MFRNKLMAIFSLVIIASMLLAACTPETIIKTVEVQVEKTVEVQVEKTVEVQVEKTVEVQVEKTVEVQVEVDAEPFTTPHPILGDVRVRQAMAYCTNKLDLIKSVYPLLDEEQQKGLVMNTFIPTASWAYAGDENITIYEYDPAKGGALLDEAGWILDEGSGYRYNADGDELGLKFTTTSAAFRQTWAAVFESQMADCGIRILRLHAPASWWFGDTTGLSHRDFELGAFAWVGQADPGGQTLWACDQIPLPKNGWVGQNYMGWCNEAASAAIKKANNTLIQQERIDNYRIVQAEYTKDVPAIPLFNRTETYAIAADITGLVPPIGTAYYTWNAYEWEKAGADTIIIGFTQEPATLFTLVESALVANQALSLIDGFGTTDQNYGYQARMLKQLSTIESGLASNNDVEVKEGDMILDANGEVVALAAGVKVKNAANEEVEFASGTVTMKQLVVKYEYNAGLTYSDGQPLKKADFELAYKINCDPESGATTFITCDRIQSVEFVDDVSYIVTWKPGVQDPFYYLPAIGWYPSHRVLSDGRVLADVPAKEWATLTEIAENPIGVGPYMLTEWEKGVSMTFEANPYFYLGAPKTPKIVILFVSAENAEAQLLTGEVDVLDGTTLTGLSQQLVDAATAGTIVTFINPSATWEHIDFNLFLK